jgi:hypothetical protein
MTKECKESKGMKAIRYALVFVLALSSIDTVQAFAQTSIPQWVRNDAMWWGQGLVSDSEYIKTIQWLVDNGYITVNALPKPTVATMPNSLLPSATDIGPLWQTTSTPSSFMTAVNATSNPIFLNQVESESSSGYMQSTTTSTTTAMLGITELRYPCDAVNGYNQIVQAYRQEYSNPMPWESLPFDKYTIYFGAVTFSGQYETVDLIGQRNNYLIIFEMSGNSNIVDDTAVNMLSMVFDKIQGEIQVQSCMQG